MKHQFLLGEYFRLRNHCCRIDSALYGPAINSAALKKIAARFPHVCPGSSRLHLQLLAQHEIFSKVIGTYDMFMIVRSSCFCISGSNFFKPDV
jgi:hypothetical protein